MNKEIISDITLEKFILGELPGQRLKELEKIISSDKDLQKRISAIKKSNESILKKYPPGVMAERISLLASQDREISKTKKGLSLKLMIIPSAIAVSAAALLFLVPVFNSMLGVRTATESDDVTRIKGDETRLYIYRKKNGGAELLQNGSIAKKNDLIQIAYTVPKSLPYGIIVSVDGRGSVTAHYPKDGNSTRLSPEPKTVLQNSYELDDAPLFEKFFLITSSKQLNLDEIIDKIKKRAGDPLNILKYPLNIDAGLNETSITITKER